MLKIAHLRRWITRNVDDRLGAEREQLFQKRFVRSFAGWINHHHGLGRRKDESIENACGVACLKRSVGYVVGGGIFLGENHRALADFDASDLFERSCSRQGEEPASTVGIDQEASARRGRLFTDITGKGRQNKRVILKEVPREEVKLQIAHGLGDHLLVILRYLARGVTQQA